MLTADSAFYRFVREERLFAAVLAHLLLQRGPNLARFLELVNARLSADQQLRPDHFRDGEVYVEFTYLRDMWDGFGRSGTRSRQKANALKRAFITDAMGRIPSLRVLAAKDLGADIARFNEQFMGEAG